MRPESPSHTQLYGAISKRDNVIVCSHFDSSFVASLNFNTSIATFASSTILLLLRFVPLIRLLVMPLVEADVASADFEAGLAAAHAEVGRLEALLVAEKVKVNWYHRAIRRQEAAPPVAAEEAKRVENAKERKEEKQAAALLDAAKAVPPMAVEEAATPVAAEEARHMENAGPARKVRNMLKDRFQLTNAQLAGTRLEVYRQAADISVSCRAADCTSTTEQNRPRLVQRKYSIPSC